MDKLSKIQLFEYIPVKFLLKEEKNTSVSYCKNAKFKSCTCLFIVMFFAS